jgi:hypothetical protein
MNCSEGLRGRFVDFVSRFLHRFKLRKAFAKPNEIARKGIEAFSN